MKQLTLAASRGFEKHGRATRKAEFLARMEGLIPWAEFCALIEPHYPKAGNGRPPVGVERMLRMYCIANWFNLGDVACEDALYDVPVFREFCRIDLGQERVPDATTLMNFRHLLEAHQLGAALFAKVGELLMVNGMRLSGGTIVDATLIAAPPSTKNQHKARDPERAEPAGVLHALALARQKLVGAAGADDHGGAVGPVDRRGEDGEGRFGHGREATVHVLFRPDVRFRAGYALGPERDHGAIGGKRGRGENGEGHKEKQDGGEQPG